MRHHEICTSGPEQLMLSDQLNQPFAALLDTRDSEWTDRDFLNNKIVELIDRGCRYFVCFGPNSEVIHDRIDDIIISYSQNIEAVTTFHEDEQIEDVAAFFKFVVTNEMQQGILITKSEQEWLSLLQYE